MELRSDPWNKIHFDKNLLQDSLSSTVRITLNEIVDESRNYRRVHVLHKIQDKSNYLRFNQSKRASTKRMKGILSFSIKQGILFYIKATMDT